MFFRWANRAARNVTARQYHKPAGLPYDPAKGLSPFLSAPSVDFLYNMRQVDLINSINRLSEGTEHENASLLRIVYDSYQDPDKRALLNYASQAWNLDFFMQSLTNKSDQVPREDVRRQIADSFDSFDRFKEAFSQSALAMFGNGWTWLVLNDNGQLSVMNTYNADSPFTAISSNPKRMDKGLSYTTLQKGVGRRPFVKLTPILGISMWQEAFLPDYGLDRGTYINRFWDAVNWDVVHERLLPPISGSRSSYI